MPPSIDSSQLRRCFRRALLLAALSTALSAAYGQASPSPSPSPSLDPNALVRKIQDEITTSRAADGGQPDPAVPHGEFLGGTITDSKIYPGTENYFQVYVPAQYDPSKPGRIPPAHPNAGPSALTVATSTTAQTITSPITSSTRCFPRSKS